jgi:hypothetical protein
MPQHSLLRRAALVAACLAVLLAAGCQRKGIEDLLGKDLFSISLGKLEDQIDLFQFEDAMQEKSTTVAMRDGWFYVANGSAGKIMVFSSYGDLLFLLYNPQENPTPVSLGPVTASAEPAGADAVTRGAVAYAFSDIGRIAVASDHTLYVEDSVTDAKAVKDAARGMVEDRVILRFDRRGRALGYLGQEGIGGTPFPYIADLVVTGQDQLVVICRMPAPDYSWQVFWYSRDGALLYRAQVDSAHLPVRSTSRSTPLLVKIVPDFQAPLLYLAINTYTAAPAAGAADDVTAGIYKLDLRTGRYNPSFIEFPRNPPRKERVQLKTTEIPSPPSEFLGLGTDGSYYLLAYTDTNLYTLQVLDASGRLRSARRVVMEDSEFTFRDVHLSSTGLLYGLFADRTKARVAWWRSDDLAPGG